MKKINFVYFVLFGFSLLVISNTALAADLPITGIDIIIKSASTSQIVSSKTNEKGYFSFSSVPEGYYDVYINDESTNPIRVQAVDGKLSGRASLFFDDPIKKVATSTSKKVSTKKVAIKAKATVATSTSKVKQKYSTIKNSTSTSKKSN